MDLHVHHELTRRRACRSSRRDGLRRAVARKGAAALIGWVVAVLVLGVGRDALALTVELTPTEPAVVGQPHTFGTATTDAEGAVSYEWRFGDSGDFQAGDAEMVTTFTEPGLVSVEVRATDAAGSVGSDYQRHLVHHPLTPNRPTSAAPMVYDAARNRIYSANQDNDTITAIDPEDLTVLGELEVYRKPESLALSPSGLLWVVHQDDYAVAVVDPDAFAIVGGFRLPYASQPVSIAMSPTGDAAYIVLSALGKLLRLDPVTGIISGEVSVGPRPRGVAVSHDGRDVYVTRFISSDLGGEVIKVDSATMTVASTILLRLDTESEDSDQRARGLPNYLFSIALTPDGRSAWVPGKKDNIVRGLLRDGQEITHDTTVRPLASIIDLGSAEELYESRVDLDDRSNPVHVEFNSYGNLAFLTLAGSNRVEVRDVTNPTQVFSAIANAGVFPRASLITPNQRLFVQGSLSRNVLVYDVSRLLGEFDQGSPPLIADIPTVSNEKLSQQVLLGKQIFHNAEDTRMAFEGYMACGGCHFEGIDDGRVYDFSSRGEGLRNTLSLLGTGQGRFNWTGNLDEIQDFEHQIRELFDGLGFMADDMLHSGTRDQPLGEPKAGVSPELDALAAYVGSLEHVNPSPFRNQDGTLTEDGLAGKAIFEKLGCDFCHGGEKFTDSERGMLHDVGTITEQSGTRSGEPLLGFDTPTLRGVWETPPYLHDGSAATLKDVLTTRNPTGLHGFTSALSGAELDQLVAYLLQIDDELPIRRLPFEPPGEPAAGPDPAAPGPSAAGGTPSVEPHDAGKGVGDSGCRVASSSPSRLWLLLLVASCLGLRRRHRGRPRGGAPW